MVDGPKELRVCHCVYAAVAREPGTSLVLSAGHGARLPTPPFNMVVAPVNTLPLASNAEIVRVTNIATDTLTVERQQESSAARTIQAGDAMFAAVTELTFTQLLEAGVRAAHTISGTTAAAWESVYFCEAGSNFELLFPTAVGNAGKSIVVIVTTGTKAVTLKPNGSQKIKGLSSLEVGLEPAQEFSSVTVFSDGSNLQIA